MEVIKMVAVGLRLNEKLLERMRKYVEREKLYRSYSIQELIRVAVEEYLNKEEEDG